MPRLMRLAQIFATATVQIVLVALIIGLLLANWMPALYQSEWFQQRFGSSADAELTTGN